MKLTIHIDKIESVEYARKLLFEIQNNLESTDFYLDIANTKVSLQREEDRSAANLLSIANASGHYKHHKIPITEV